MSKNGPAANYPAGFLYIYTLIYWVVGRTVITCIYYFILLTFTLYLVFTKNFKWDPPVAIVIFDRFKVIESLWKDSSMTTLHDLGLLMCFTN